MSGQGNFKEDETLSTKEFLELRYNVVKRQNLVLGRLESATREILFADVKNEIYGIGFAESGVGNSATRYTQPEDIIVLRLRHLQQEIKTLKLRVESYEGPHFTNDYRTTQSLCSKLQQDLDSLDLIGREDIRKDRKEALLLVDEMAKKLASRAHKDGKSCEYDDCRVRK